MQWECNGVEWEWNGIRMEWNGRMNEWRKGREFVPDGSQSVWLDSRWPAQATMAKICAAVAKAARHGLAGRLGGEIRRGSIARRSSTIAEREQLRRGHAPDFPVMTRDCGKAS